MNFRLWLESVEINKFYKLPTDSPYVKYGDIFKVLGTKVFGGEIFTKVQWYSVGEKFLTKQRSDMLPPEVMEEVEEIPEPKLPIYYK